MCSNSDPLEIWVSEFIAAAGTRLWPMLEKYEALLDPAVFKMLVSVRDIPLTAYYESVFRRYTLRDRMRKLFEKYDLLLSPTTPVAAFDILRNAPPGEAWNDNCLSWIYYTYPFNLTGHPAASIPAGLSADGLPVGLQMVAGTNMETDIFRAAAAFEYARPWSHLRPMLAIDKTRGSVAAEN